MNKVYYPTSKTFIGPFLIPTENFLELDRVIDSIRSSLSTNRENLIKSEVEDALEYYKIDERAERRGFIEETTALDFDEINVSISVGFNEPKHISSTTFKDIVLDELIRNDLAKYFDLNIRYGSVHIKLEYERFPHSDKIVLSVSPQNNPQTKEIFYELNKWIENNSSSSIVRLWKKISSNIMFLLPPFIIFSLLFFVQIKESLLKQEAAELLKNGISSDELNRAVEIILRDSFNIGNELGKSTLDFNFLIYFIILIALSLILYLSPRTTFGFGKGDKRVKMWKTWIKIALITIPSAIIIPILINKLSAFL